MTTTDFGAGLRDMRRELALATTDARFKQRWDAGNEAVRVAGRRRIKDPQGYVDAVAAMHALNDEYTIGLAEAFRDLDIPSPEGCPTWDAAIDAARQTAHEQEPTDDQHATEEQA